MKINVDIPNVTIETVKSMGNLTGWTPSQSLNRLSRDMDITPEAIEQLGTFSTLGHTELEFDLDEDALDAIIQLAVQNELTIRNTISAMIIQVVIDKLAEDKQKTH